MRGAWAGMSTANEALKLSKVAVDVIAERDKLQRQRDALLTAAKAAKKYLEPDLVEPGRTVFWNLVAAIEEAEK